MNSRKLKWKSDFDKEVVIGNFIKRGWAKTEKDDEEWNVYWATVWNVRSIFNPKSGIRLHDGQIINHFPNHFQLTRKDLMVKNIKRFKKECEKLDVDSVNIDFIPQTFILPGEYSLFNQEFHRSPNNTWIVKPNNKSQGQGIFLLKKIHQLKKIANGQNLIIKNFSSTDLYIISKYIQNPLLIGGKKFDLRIYVLVTNYRPLKVYLYDKGFARFCNQQYTTDVAQMQNMFIHLTNVAVQKFSDKYSEKHGGKWSIKCLRFYIQSIFGTEKAARCFEQINNIIINALKSVQTVIINDKHCFQMYGFDILLDSNCKPWLLEINASPSLTTTTKTDLDLKMNLLKDTYDIVIPEDWGEENGKVGSSTCQSSKVGGYTLLYDESLDSKRTPGTKRTVGSKIWR